MSPMTHNKFKTPTFFKPWYLLYRCCHRRSTKFH